MNNNISANNYLPVSLTNIFLVSAITFTPISIQQQQDTIKSECYSNFDSENRAFSFYSEPIKINRTIDVENKINSMRSYEKNWDGYNADIPEDIVLYNAYKFLNVLPESIQVELSSDRVVLTPYGTIVFDFEKNSNILSIEIGEKNIGFFSDFTDNNNYYAEQIAFNPNKLDETLAKAFNKLYDKVI